MGPDSSNNSQVILMGILKHQMRECWVKKKNMQKYFNSDAEGVDGESGRQKVDEKYWGKKIDGKIILEKKNWSEKKLGNFFCI